ncbi:MAG: hypothetical protein JW760_02700 [Spirochaetales bacterium]|nr:hypothetical protein [Spirochaetales bacterium]
MAQRRNYRNSSRRRSGEQTREQPKIVKVEWHTPCPLCGEKITDLSSALTERISGNPAHFECVMKQIAQAEDLQKDEKVSYLGNGSFGILQQAPGGQFKIRKKIPYEEKETSTEWRRNLISIHDQDPRKQREKK